MKVAVCFSGQPRTWRNCVDQWHRLFSELKTRHGADIDFFMHGWKANSLPHAVAAVPTAETFLSDRSVPVQDAELQDLLHRLNPKSYLFEDSSVGIEKVADTFRLGKRHDIYHGEPAISWAASQFYSVMRSAHLKKKYEFKNGFRYDACIRMRYDLYFDDTQIEYFLNNDFVKPDINTVYPCHSGIDDSMFPYFRMGDIFWYADSVTFDRVCDFYRWLPIIGKKSFQNKNPSTEHTLYFYSKMIRMNVLPISVDPKIFRSADYIDEKIKAGLPGELGGHELI